MSDATKLRVQALGVCALVCLVGWPQFRPPARTVTIWRTDGPLAPRHELVTTDARVTMTQAGVGLMRVGYGIPPGQPLDKLRQAGLTNLSPDLRARGARLNAIVGYARTSLNQPVPYARLVLRNPVTGKVTTQAIADDAGSFTFLDLDPSRYVVELVSEDGSVVASSSMVSVGEGDLRQTVVRVAANATVRAVFGGVTTATAPEPVERAVETGTRNVTQPAATTEPSL